MLAANSTQSRDKQRTGLMQLLQFVITGFTNRVFRLEIGSDVRNIKFHKFNMIFAYKHTIFVVDIAGLYQIRNNP